MSNLHIKRESSALYQIWSHENLSRGQIAQILHLKPPTVSSLVNDLIESGRILEGEYAESSGGRRARLLEIVPYWGWIIGIEFSSTGISSTAANMKGDILNLSHTRYDRSRGQDKIIAHLKNAIRQQIAYIRKINDKPILRIGLSVSGLVDETRGISINFPHMENWKEVPLKSIVEKEFNIPVLLENRITASTMAEHLFGHHKDTRDALLFHLGPGLGMGMILSGEVRRGSRWSVGEFGHVSIADDGPLCYCGKRGCLESLASDYALVQQVKKAIEGGVNTRILDFAGGQISAEAICLAAADGDRLAHGLIEKVGYYIATAVANILNILGPEVILFTGTMVESSDILLDCIRRNLRVHTLEYIEKNVQVEKATFGTEGGIRGAVTMALHQFYSNHAG